MLLRASGQAKGEDYDLRAVTDDAAVSGVPHGEALTAFAEASVRGGPEQIAGARDALAAEMGPLAVVDAAGVAANFQRMTRIADATGIPLDKPVAIFSVDMRDELGIDSFGAAANTPPVGAALRAIGRVAQPLLTLIMKSYAARRKNP